MATKDALGYVLVAGLAAGGSYYFFKEQIRSLQDRITQLEEQRYAEYGVLSAVNRIQLAIQPANYRCSHLDKQGLGRGEIHYAWSTEYSYGVDVQGYDWNSNITRVDDKTLKVTVPNLIQLNPIKVEFDDFIETNEASGNRWERMYKHAVSVGQNWMGKDADNLPYSRPAIVKTAKQQLENHLKGLLNAERPADKQIESLTVEFKRPYTTRSALKFHKACRYL